MVTACEDRGLAMHPFGAPNEPWKSFHVRGSGPFLDPGLSKQVIQPPPMDDIEARSGPSRFLPIDSGLRGESGIICMISGEHVSRARHSAVCAPVERPESFPGPKLRSMSRFCNTLGLDLGLTPRNSSVQTAFETWSNCTTPTPSYAHHL